MAHPYPPHQPGLPYTGKYSYFLTFCTRDSALVFTACEAVSLVLAQFLRAAREFRFEISAYCFMPDHVHLVVRGLAEESHCKSFIKMAKQYSGFYFNKAYGRRLWQRYGFERVIRDDAELAFVIGYIIANPVRAALVGQPSDYPHTGSEKYTIQEMLEISDTTGEGLPTKRGCALISRGFRLKAEATRDRFRL